MKGKKLQFLNKFHVLVIKFLIFIWGNFSDILLIYSIKLILE